ncbi:hypothetical protein AB0M95_15285 [Sphaerisporangium sp. NPDC051017]|uniref:hypothetical protein n=1 Tax=Sphaerisporangium sp. NPDC051017 TaxID=3154636 RepID=UPI00342EBAD1
MRMRVALAVALLATGCAAGAERPFTPGGSSGATPAPGATSDVSSGAGVVTPGAPKALSTAGAETVDVAPGLSVSIEWPAGLDSARQAMVRSFTDGYVGAWRAVTTGGEDKSYLDGVEDEAARDAYTWVRGFLNRGESATGTAKLYALRVASVVGRGAEVDACVDESGLQVTGTDGRPVTTQPSWTRPPAAIYLQVAALRRGDDGAWRTRAFMHAAYPHQRAKECRR